MLVHSLREVDEKKLEKLLSGLSRIHRGQFTTQKKCFIIPTAKEPFKLSMFKKTSQMLRISGKYDK